MMKLVDGVKYEMDEANKYLAITVPFEKLITEPSQPLNSLVWAANMLGLDNKRLKEIEQNMAITVGDHEFRLHWETP